MRLKWIVSFIFIMILCRGYVFAQEPQELLTLEESIKIALEKNLQLHSAVEGITASQFREKEAVTNFLPLWTGQYNYVRYNSPVTVGSSGISGLGGSGSRDIFNFGTTISQPLFTGGLNLANYRLAKVGSRYLKNDCRDTEERYCPSGQSGFLQYFKGTQIPGCGCTNRQTI